MHPQPMVTASQLLRLEHRNDEVLIQPSRGQGWSERRQIEFIEADELQNTLNQIIGNQNAIVTLLSTLLQNNAFRGLLTVDHISKPNEGDNNPQTGN